MRRLAIALVLCAVTSTAWCGKRPMPELQYSCHWAWDGDSRASPDNWWGQQAFCLTGTLRNNGKKTYGMIHVTWDVVDSKTGRKAGTLFTLIEDVNPGDKCRWKTWDTFSTNIIGRYTFRLADVDAQGEIIPRGSELDDSADGARKRLGLDTYGLVWRYVGRLTLPNKENWVPAGLLRNKSKKTYDYVIITCAIVDRQTGEKISDPRPSTILHYVGAGGKCSWATDPGVSFCTNTIERYTFRVESITTYTNKEAQDWKTPSSVSAKSEGGLATDKMTDVPARCIRDETQAVALGLTMDAVRDVLGVPSAITSDGSLKEDIWYYGSHYVVFRQDRATSWNISDDQRRKLVAAAKSRRAGTAR